MKWYLDVTLPKPKQVSYAERHYRPVNPYRAETHIIRLSLGGFPLRVVPVFTLLTELYGFKAEQIIRWNKAGYLPLAPFEADRIFTRSSTRGLYLIGQAKLCVQAINTVLQYRSNLCFNRYPDLIDYWHQRHETIYDHFLYRSSRSGIDDLKDMLSNHSLEECIDLLAT